MKEGFREMIIIIVNKGDKIDLKIIIDINKAKGMINSLDINTKIIKGRMIIKDKTIIRGKMITGGKMRYKMITIQNQLAIPMIKIDKKHIQGKNRGDL
jgi:hypothetical protein